MCNLCLFYRVYIKPCVLTNMMSMSMVVDQRPSGQNGRTGWTIPPRTPATWIPDARVRRCFGCNSVFSLLNRKHHCRSCGRIFCASCSSYREVIPIYFRTYAPSAGQEITAQRTCAPCAKQMRIAAQVEWLTTSISRMPVPFAQIFDLRLINKQWNQAVNTLLSLYRGLQYKLPCQKYSELECDFLWTHHKHFAGHTSWQLHTLASLKQRGQLTDTCIQSLGTGLEVRLSCRRLLCSRTCHSNMSVDDILRLGTSGALSHVMVQKWVINSWFHFHGPVHVQMMPWWVYLATRYANLFKHGLIPMASKSLIILYALWFECNVQMNKKTVKILKQVQQRIKAAISVEDYRAVKASEAFAGMAVMLIKSMGPYVIAKFFHEFKSVRLPWEPQHEIISVQHVDTIWSSSRPLVIECRTNRGELKTFLLKNEDVRSDRLAMTLGFFIQSMTSNVHIKTYKVFPLSSKMGCVEMVPHATTLYDVRKKGSLLNFTMSHNSSLSVRTLRERLVKSCAGACLLAFTIGLGDRHLENIMITDEAFLVHVDFGWILGDDPKHAATPMRITEDMVDAMGGRGSSTFASFVQITQQAYVTMRQHASFWYHLLVAESFIFQNRHRDWKRIRNHVLERFVPGEWEEEASLHIQTVVQNASEPSLVQRVVDFSHFAANQIDGFFRMDL